MMRVTAQRLPGNPILTRFAERRVGVNVNGPSLIRVPDWVPAPLGRYYLYFAHHIGGFIRMAFADDLNGPWRVHAPGVLDLAEVPHLHDHIASPDVHVDMRDRVIRMYFHGVSDPTPFEDPPQMTGLATSADGLAFHARPELLGASYFRVWAWEGWHYAVSLGGRLWRSRDGVSPFEAGAGCLGLPQGTRHLAVLVAGDTLWVAWSVIGDAPERIFIGQVDLRADWTAWQVGNIQELLRPERDWEGADLPIAPSRAGLADTRVHELRDPAFFSEDGVTYLLYAVAGEAGLGMARLTFEEERT
ncbi:MAG: hypothetical protein AAF382_15660 [Pseudomonadota bacterium]